MAKRTFRPGGIPVRTDEEIEAEIDQLKREGARTEAWMNSRARTQMQKLGEGDRNLQRAYEAGYRSGSETNWWLFVALVILFILVQLFG